MGWCVCCTNSSFGNSHSKQPSADRLLSSSLSPTGHQQKRDPVGLLKERMPTVVPLESLFSKPLRVIAGQEHKAGGSLSNWLCVVGAKDVCTPAAVAPADQNQYAGDAILLLSYRVRRQLLLHVFGDPNRPVGPFIEQQGLQVKPRNHSGLIRCRSSVGDSSIFVWITQGDTGLARSPRRP